MYFVDLSRTSIPSLCLLAPPTSAPSHTPSIASSALLVLTPVSLFLSLFPFTVCLIFVVSFLKSGLTSPLVLHVSFLIHSSSLVPCLLCSCSDRLLSLLHSSIIPAWPAFVIPSFLLQSSFGSPFDLPSYPHYSCFLPRCRLFSLSSCRRGMQPNVKLGN